MNIETPEKKSKSEKPLFQVFIEELKRESKYISNEYNKDMTVSYEIIEDGVEVPKELQGDVTIGTGLVARFVHKSDFKKEV